jgi:hypothetical protein
MASCNNSYLRTGIDLSVLQLPKADTEEIIRLQVLQEGEAFKLKRFEKLITTKEVAG